MKKILLVNSFYFPNIIGGAEIFTQLLAESLTSNFEVYILTTGKEKTLVKEEINNVKIYRLPLNNIYWPGDKRERGNVLKLIWHFNNLYNKNQYKLLKEIINEINPDLIHSQNLMGIGTYLWTISNKRDIPIVHTTHDYQLIEPINQNDINRIMSFVNKRRSEKVNHAVGVSNFTIKKHVSTGFFKNATTNSIPNVVNCESFERKYRKPKQPLVLGYIGQLEEIKGVRLLFDILNKFDSSIIKELIVCGSGSLEDEIIAFSKGDRRLVYNKLLPSDLVQKTMAQIDLILVPSVWEEPFGRVLIEAYNQGTPVIASNVGGIPDIVYSKEWLFKKGNVKDLLSKIEKFYNLSEEQIKIEINKSYERSKNYKENLDEHKTIYDRLLKGN